MSDVLFRSPEGVNKVQVCGKEWAATPVKRQSIGHQTWRLAISTSRAPRSNTELESRCCQHRHRPARHTRRPQWHRGTASRRPITCLLREVHAHRPPAMKGQRTQLCTWKAEQWCGKSGRWQAGGQVAGDRDRWHSGTVVAVASGVCRCRPDNSTPTPPSRGW